jgi:hypothetical protein
MTLHSRTSGRLTPAVDAAGTCAVMDDDERLCSKAALPAAPWPICATHALAVYRFIGDQVADHAMNTPVLVRAVHLATMEAVRLRRSIRRPPPDVMNGWPAVVYYIRVGDLIKIGTTTSLLERVRAYPPDSQLLAVEPGAEAVEQRRHEQFAHLLAARREWFRPAADLMEHIDELAAAGLPRAPESVANRRQDVAPEPEPDEAPTAGQVVLAEVDEPPVQLLAGDLYDDPMAAVHPDDRPLVEPRKQPAAPVAAYEGPPRGLQDDHPGL